MTPEDARTRTRGFLVFGIGLIVIGSLVAALSWPHVEPAFTAVGDPEERGSRVVFTIGLLLGVAGHVLFLIGAIGYGVRLGVTAARGPEDRESS